MPGQWCSLSLNDKSITGNQHRFVGSLDSICQFSALQVEEKEVIMSSLPMHNETEMIMSLGKGTSYETET